LAAAAEPHAINSFSGLRKIASKNQIPALKSGNAGIYILWPRGRFGERNPFSEILPRCSCPASNFLYLGLPAIEFQRLSTEAPGHKVVRDWPLSGAEPSAEVGEESLKNC
jgi:hypothetical protein